MCADQFKHIEAIHYSSLGMDATSVSSKADPDNLMTISCSHRVVRICEDGEPNATRISPMRGQLVSDPQMKLLTYHLN